MGKPVMPDTQRKPCPKCGKPMIVLSANDKKVAVLKCLRCDNIDPLKEPQLEGWTRSNALRQPRGQDR
jgi:DNA-directed RNA polymerase subunit M/transcription elongation factor TFIIS